MGKKRTFRNLSGAKAYRPWKNWEVGDFVIGKLVDTEIDQYKKTCYILELEEVSFNDAEAERNAQDLGRIGLNHTGLLAKIMDDKCEIGQVVRVEYQGTSTMQKGPNAGAEAHSLLISVAEEDEECDTGESLSDDDDL